APTVLSQRITSLCPGIELFSHAVARLRLSVLLALVKVAPDAPSNESSPAPADAARPRMRARRPNGLPAARREVTVAMFFLRSNCERDDFLLLGDALNPTRRVTSPMHVARKFHEIYIAVHAGFIERFVGTEAQDSRELHPNCLLQFPRVCESFDVARI